MKPEGRKSITLSIVNELGLHARSAAKLAKLASEAKGPVWLDKGDEPADASSMLDVLTLNCPKGTRVRVCIENESDVIIMLKTRFRLTGEIKDNEGNKVADVVVRAKRLGTVGGADDGVVRTYEGITGGNGTFDLAVDSGRYNVYFIPPAASGLPRQLPKRVYIADENETLTVSLPAPAAVKGHIFDQFGEPQCDVTIDVYSSTETNAYLIGQTISDSPDDGCDGSYTVIIPAALVPEE